MNMSPESMQDTPWKLLSVIPEVLSIDVFIYTGLHINRSTDNIMRYPKI